MERGLLEKCLPRGVDFFEERAHHSTVFKELYVRLATLGGVVTEYLQRCAHEDEAYEQDVRQAHENNDDDAFFGIVKSTFVGERQHVKALETLYDAWFSFFLEHWEVMHEVQIRVIEDECEPGTNKPRKIRTTLGTSVFTELLRITFLLQRPAVVMEIENEHVRLSTTKNPLWIRMEQTFDISNQYEEKEDRDTIVEDRLQLLRSMWERPIIEYRQSECVLLTFFITQQMDSLKSDCFQEFQLVFSALLYRIGLLVHRAWNKDVLDEPSFCIEVAEIGADARLCNRDFLTFCSFYLGDIARRFFYYGLHQKGQPCLDLTEAQCSEFSEHVRAWINRFINEMPEEAFRDMYTENCNEAYNFPGDDRWFRYKWPIKVHTRSECLRQLRPHLYRRYHSEDRTTKRMCLATISESYASRTFLLKALNSYIHSKSGGNHIDWFGRAVINSKQIAEAQYELMSNESPQLVQILSSFWAYDRKQLFMTDDIFLSIGVWFLILFKRYNSRFFGNSLFFFVSEAVPKGLCQLNINEGDLPIDPETLHLISSCTLRL